MKQGELEYLEADLTPLQLTILFIVVIIVTCGIILWAFANEIDEIRSIVSYNYMIFFVYLNWK